MGFTMDNEILQLQKNINTINFTTTLVEDGIDGYNTQEALEAYYTYFKKLDIAALSRVVKDNRNRIKYITQRGPYKYSYRMCSIASTLMLLNLYSDVDMSIPILDNLIDNDNELIKWAAKYGLEHFIKSHKLEQVSTVIAKVLTKLTPSEYSFSLKYLSRSEISKYLENGHPLITSTRFPGRKTNNMKSGHYIVITAELLSGVYTIQDPWGMWENYYKHTADVNIKGKDVTISGDILFGKWGSKTEYSDNGGCLNKFRTIGIDL